MFEVFGLGAEFTFNAEGVDRITDVVDRLQTLQTAMGNGTGDTREYANALGEFGSVISDMGKQLTLAGAATTAAVAAGVHQAADWQTEMVSAIRYMDDAYIESQGGAEQAQLAYNQTLKETAQLLGVSKSSINDATIAYMQMGKPAELALQLAKNAGYAGVAWDMAASEVSDAFRSIKAGFNINLEDKSIYQHYLDNINEVGNSTAATSQDVVRFVSEAGASLHNVAGVSIEETMAMASAVRFANLSVDEAGTMFTRLSNQFAKGKSVGYFEELGVKLKDDEGKAKSFAELLYEVQMQWNNLSDDKKSTFASGVGGAFADRLSLYLGSGEEYKKALDIAMRENSGSAEAEFNRVTDTFNMSMSRLKVTLSDFNTAFWTALLDPLNSIVKVLNEVITKFSNWMQAHPQIMAMTARVVALSGVIATAVGGFLIFTGVIAKMRQAMLLGMGPIQMFKKVIQGIGLVFGGGIPQVMLFAGAIAGLYWLFTRGTDGMQEDLANLVEGFQTSFADIRMLISSDTGIDEFKQKWESLDTDTFFGKVTAGVSQAILAVQGFFQYLRNGEISEDLQLKLDVSGMSDTVNYIISIWEQLLPRLQALWGGFKEGFVSAVDSMVGVVKTVFTPIIDIVSMVAEKIFGIKFDPENMFGDISKWEAIGKVLGVVLAGFLAFKTVTGVINTVKGAIGGVTSMVGNLPGMGGNGNGGQSGPLGGGISNLIPNPTDMLKGMADVAIVLGGFTLIVEAYGALSTIPGFTEYLSSGMDTLSLLFSNTLQIVTGLAGLGIITALAGQISPATMGLGIANIAIVLGGFTLIFEAFGALTQIPGFNEFLGAGAQTLGQLFDAMSVFADPAFIGMTVAIGIMGAVNPATFALGIASLAIVLGGMTLIISAFSALSMIPGFNEFIDTGVQTLAQLFNGIGVLIGSVIGGIGEGITNSLPAIGENLAGFATAVKPFFETMAEVPLDGVGPFLESLGAFMLMMAGDALASLITGGTDLSALGQDLCTFGTSAAGFFDSVATYPEEGLEKAPRVFEAISNLGGYATKSGGLAQLFTGTTNLPELGSNLTEFGKNAAGFFAAAATFDDVGIEKAPKIFDAISSLGGYATKSGGVAQWFTGTTDLPGLGTDLSNFGNNVATFFNTVSGFTDKSIANAKEVFNVLALIGDYGYKSGGVAQWFTGTTDIAGIGTQLADFAGSVKGFFDLVGGFTFESIDKVKKLFEALDFIGNSSFRSGGFFEIFTGGVDLVNIGNQLSSFAESLKGMFDVVVNVDFASITKIKNIFEALQGVGDFTRASLLMTDLGGAGTQLSEFITNAETFFNKAKDIETSGVTTISGPLKEFMSVFAGIDAGNINASASGLSAFGEALIQVNSAFQQLSVDVETVKTTIDNVTQSSTTWGTDVITNFTSGFDGGSSNVQSSVDNVETIIKNKLGNIDLNTEGSTTMGSFVTGLDSTVGDITGVMETAHTNITNPLNNIKSEMNTIGVNIVSGLIEGMNSKCGELNTVANSIAAQIKSTMQNAMKIQSPSQVMADDIGVYIPAGIAEGMLENTSSIIDASNVMGNIATKSVSTWGTDVVNGFVSGITESGSAITDALSNTITNPINDALNNNGTLPISTNSELTQNEMLNVGGSLGVYLSNIVTLLSMIAENNGNIVGNNFDSNGSLTDTSFEQQQRVEQAGQVIAENNANTNGASITIDAGAITNSFTINSTDGMDPNSIMEMIMNTLDSQLLPLMLQKVKEYEGVLNQ